MFIAAVFMAAKKQKQSKYSLMAKDKESMAHIYNGLLFSHKWYEILPFVTTQMDLDLPDQ